MIRDGNSVKFYKLKIYFYVSQYCQFDFLTHCTLLKIGIYFTQALLTQDYDHQGEFT